MVCKCARRRCSDALGDVGEREAGIKPAERTLQLLQHSALRALVSAYRVFNGNILDETFAVRAAAALCQVSSPPPQSISGRRSCSPDARAEPPQSRNRNEKLHFKEQRWARSGFILCDSRVACQMKLRTSSSGCNCQSWATAPVRQHRDGPERHASECVCVCVHH